MEHSITRSDWRSLITPRWIIITLLIIAAILVMIRLGFWQLDRLKQRRAFNATVEAQITAPALNLNKSIPLNQLTGMEYRQVTVTGTYDPSNQIALRNQVNNNMPGYALFTPLKIAGTDEAVLVDRGFIPMSDNQPSDWGKYAQPGTLTVQGIIRNGHVPTFAGVADPPLAAGQTRLDLWNNVNMPRLAKQTPYKILPVYIQLAPDPSNTSPTMPIASLDQPDLTDGPHLSYAIQWFSFAAIFAIGYPFLIRRALKKR